MELLTCVEVNDCVVCVVVGEVDVGSVRVLVDSVVHLEERRKEKQ